MTPLAVRAGARAASPSTAPAPPGSVMRPANHARIDDMKKLALGWMLLLGLYVACTDDDSGPAPRTFGAACTTESDTSTECDSGVCTNSFDMIGHPVCSVKCTTADPSVCPSGSEGKKCNMKGYCKP
jgi:hypothetical protein